jgi:hypothetical protein
MALSQQLHKRKFVGHCDIVLDTNDDNVSHMGIGDLHPCII